MRCRADERVEDSHYSQEYSLALIQKLVQRNIIIFSRDGGVEGLNTKNPQESANANENMPLAIGVFLGLENIRLLSRSCANVTISARSR